MEDKAAWEKELEARRAELRSLQNQVASLETQVKTLQGKPWTRLRSKLLRPWLGLALLAALAVKLGSETLSLTAIYPSPTGVYNSLITTGYPVSGVAANTILNREGGTVVVGSNAATARNSILLTPRASPPPAPNATGELYFTSSGNFEYWNGSAWAGLGGGGPSTWTCQQVGPVAPIVQCPAANFVLISGGCDTGASGFPERPGSGIQQWRCPVGISAYAICCQ